jgi:hypothetical protein
LIDDYIDKINESGVIMYNFTINYNCVNKNINTSEKKNIWENETKKLIINFQKQNIS